MADATVLVVDDEPQIRRVLQATVSSSGYDVSEANNGPEAVEMVNRERPTLILPAPCKAESDRQSCTASDSARHLRTPRSGNPPGAPAAKSREDNKSYRPEVSDNYLRNQF